MSLIGELTARWAEQAKLPHHYNAQSLSTNFTAKEGAFSSDLNDVIKLYVTDHQTQGRGRGSHKWVNSVLGSNLLCTWSFASKVPPTPLLSCWVGLAIFRSLSSTWPYLPWSLKAPNDVYLAEKKVGGLLIEAISQGDLNRILIGYGFNVKGHPTVFSEATDLVTHGSEGSFSEPLWSQFLDRMLLELSLCMSRNLQAPAELSEKWALLSALNRFPLLKEKYIDIDDHGNLYTPTSTISWSQL